MNRVSIHFFPDDVKVSVPYGTLLLDAALDAGVFIKAACGGSGACGQCKVRVVKGSVEALMEEKVHAAARAAGYVLACQTRAISDVTIEIPLAKVGRKVIPRDEAERMRLTARPMESPIVPEPDPMTIRVFMHPPAPATHDNVSDDERLIRTLKVEHEVHPVVAGLEVLKQLPSEARKESWEFTAYLEVETCHDTHNPWYRITRVQSGHATYPSMALAVDIGTTSLWGELVNVDTGEVKARASRYNPQIAMGDDVISRIVFALKKDGLERLQGQVVKGINEIVDECVQKSNLPLDCITYMVAAGNTVMTHLFLGLFPKISP